VASAPFDTLKLARALRDRAGFSQEHAEAAADAFAEIVAEQVATKQDIRDVQAEIRDVRAEIDALRTEMRAEFAAVRAEMRTEIAALRTEMRAEFGSVRSDMAAGFRDVEQRITIRLGGMLVVFAGLLLAAKFFG
jgi:predicted  nucleic acid-binding Zn-ribbon protein